MQTGSTAIHIAAQNGFAEVVRLLLEHGTDGDIPDSVSVTAMLCLCIKVWGWGGMEKGGLGYLQDKNRKIQYRILFSCVKF